MNFFTSSRGRTPEERSFRIDSVRQAADGIVRPLQDSVFLIVAIRYFSAGDFWKGLISASTFIGFFLSVPLTGFLHGRRMSRSGILSLLTALSAAFLLAGMLAASGAMFALAVTCSSAAVSLRQPFFTDLYGDMYPAERRAWRISLGLRLLQILSLGTGLLYGYLLDGNLGRWRGILFFAVLILSASAVLLARLPDSDCPLAGKGGLSVMIQPFRNPVFLYVQSAWMLVGFANLWTLPLRAVYVAESERGLGLSPAMVTLVLAVVPAAVKLLLNPLWARLYPRLSFPAFRMAVNFFFMVSTPLFFLTDSLWVIFLSTVLLGIGTSGSPFIWQLWVTRLVAPEETRVYQSAHAFLAGIRGVVAPFVGFAVLREVGFRNIGYISFLLTFLSILMMIPLLRADRRF